MRRWFLSFSSHDFALVQALRAALQRKDPDANIFFPPDSMRAGGFWKPQLAKEIEESTAFILLIGEMGLDDWQVTEYYEALYRRVREPGYPIILIVSIERPVPGLSFARLFHWLVSKDPASEATISKLMDAEAGVAQTPSELWRFTQPYCGFRAITEANSDYFFGRDRETVEALIALAGAPDRLATLVGSSGVGKSSLAQAGVLSALKRRAWPERASEPGPWPQAFQDSRHWCFLKLRPGTEPIRSLVAPVLDTWQFSANDPERAEQENRWIELLRDRNGALRDLLDATGHRYEKELNQPKPLAYFLYIDQGEELYVRSEEQQRRRFSELLAEALPDPRLRAMMSLRSDFLGHLQGDEPLFASKSMCRRWGRRSCERW
jgi:hypothetical protein